MRMEMRRILFVFFFLLMACSTLQSTAEGSTPLIPVETIAARNSRTPTNTFTVIPISTSTRTATITATPFDCGPSDGWVLYSVQVGDTVTSLTDVFGLPETDILKASCLEEGAVLFPGMSLYVPFIPTPTITETEPAQQNPQKFVGVYICSGTEGGFFATYGCITINADGTILAGGERGFWRYDESSHKILFSPESFYLDYGLINTPNPGLNLYFHKWAIQVPSHAETGYVFCTNVNSLHSNDNPCD